MSIVIRQGHNRQATGASATNVGGLDETTEARILCPLTINYLKRAGETVIDGSPGNCDEDTDLKHGTDVANNAHADLFVPEHFNKAYNSYKGAIGSEIWINPSNPKAVQVGTRILNNLEALGFRNRGLKDGMNDHHLHDIRACVGTAVLVEVCFCEATEDIRIYRKVGADAVAKAIAEGILGHGTAKITTPSKSNTPAISTAPSTRVNNSIAQLQAECNRQGFSNQRVDGFYGENTLNGCPTTRHGANGNITKWLQKRLGMPVKLQTGFFGDLTLGEVVNYQRAMGLTADGIVGQATWAALLR